MNIHLTITISILFFFAIIIYFLRKNVFSLKYSLLWLLTALFMIILCVFPNLLIFISSTLGFEIPSNALFTILLGFVIIILLQQTSVISYQSEKIKTLVQVISLLEKRIREIEELER